MEWLANLQRWLAAHRLRLLGFAVAAAYWPGMASAAVIPRWGVIAVGVPLVSVIDPRGIPESLRWVFSFLLAVAALATVFASPDAMAGWLELFFIALLCVVFIAAARFESIDGLMIGLGYGLAVSSVLAVGQRLGYDFGLPQSSAPAGLFYNREVLAEFAALVFVWHALKPKTRRCPEMHYVWGYHRIRHIRIPEFYWRDYSIAAVALIPLALCQSRVAFATVIVALLYVWWPQRWSLRIMVTVLFPPMIVFSLIAMGYDKAASADHRLIMWVTTFYSWTQFGHGLGWFAAAHPAEELAHSDVLQVIAELGIGGFVLAAVPFIAFRNSRGGYHVERAVFVAICVEAVISFPLHFPASGFLAAVVAGFLAGRRDPVRLGEHLGRPEDAGHLRRFEPDDQGDGRNGGFGSGAIPVRSVHPRQAALHQTADQRYSTQT